MILGLTILNSIIFLIYGILRIFTKHMVEEFKEFLEAEGMLYLSSAENKTNCLKELADLVYVCYQYAANMGWDLDEAMHRVHESNMSKLGGDGKPIYRADGKGLKGPDYAPPNLEHLV